MMRFFFFTAGVQDNRYSVSVHCVAPVFIRACITSIRKWICHFWKKRVISYCLAWLTFHYPLTLSSKCYYGLKCQQWSEFLAMIRLIFTLFATVKNDQEETRFAKWVNVTGSAIIIISLTQQPPHLRENILTCWHAVIPGALLRPDGPHSGLSQKHRREGILNVSLNITKAIIKNERAEGHVLLCPS